MHRTILREVTSSGGVVALDGDSLPTKMSGKMETINTMLQVIGQARPPIRISTRPSAAHFVCDTAFYTFTCMPPRNAGTSRVGTTMAAAGSLWALDFDGVVCDSVGESSLSAWQVP